jgi:gliding motility-associated protein GldL
MSAGLSPAANRLLNVFVSGGAAIVIVGALFKIQHYKGADIMLPIGLLLEAAIFVVYAILPPDEVAHVKEESKASPLNSMEEMMAQANINQDNLSKLSASFSKFNTTVEKMSEIGDVVKSAGDFSTKTKEATTAMGSVATAVSSATSSLGAFNEASESTKQFHGQIQILAKNLTSLNTIYELELQESNNHLKALNQFYGKLAQASAAMNGTAEDALKAKEQIGALATNLSKLNGVYGNMLTAMQGR